VQGRKKLGGGRPPGEFGAAKKSILTSSCVNPNMGREKIGTKTRGCSFPKRGKKTGYSSGWPALRGGVLSLGRVALLLITRLPRSSGREKRKARDLVCLKVGKRKKRILYHYVMSDRGKKNRLDAGIPQSEGNPNVTGGRKKKKVGVRLRCGRTPDPSEENATSGTFLTVKAPGPQAKEKKRERGDKMGRSAPTKKGEKKRKRYISPCGDAQV